MIFFEWVSAWFTFRKKHFHNLHNITSVLNCKMSWYHWSDDYRVNWKYLNKAFFCIKTATLVTSLCAGHLKVESYQDLKREVVRGRLSFCFPPQEQWNIFIFATCDFRLCICLCLTVFIEVILVQFVFPSFSIPFHYVDRVQNKSLLCSYIILKFITNFRCVRKDYKRTDMMRDLESIFLVRGKRKLRFSFAYQAKILNLISEAHVDADF